MWNFPVQPLGHSFYIGVTYILVTGNYFTLQRGIKTFVGINWRFCEMTRLRNRTFEVTCKVLIGNTEK